MFDLSRASALALVGLLATTPAVAATLNGQVLGGGLPIANSTVTLWAASAVAPKQLAQARTGADGKFALTATGASARDTTLYLVAKGGTPAAGKAGGDNAAIALLAAVGRRLPAKVTINEMTTVASVWTHAQFIDGAAIKGHALGLKIAAGLVYFQFHSQPQYRHRADTWKYYDQGVAQAAHHVAMDV